MQVRLSTEVEGAAPEQVARLTESLRDDLRAFGVLSAEHAPAVSSAPKGAKGDAFEWAQLLVTFAANLPALMAFVGRWAGDNRGTRVRLELDGDAIELDGATSTEQHEMLARFLARHPE